MKNEMYHAETSIVLSIRLQLRFMTIVSRDPFVRAQCSCCCSPQNNLTWSIQYHHLLVCVLISLTACLPSQMQKTSEGRRLARTTSSGSNTDAHWTTWQPNATCHPITFWTSVGTMTRSRWLRGGDHKISTRCTAMPASWQGIAPVSTPSLSP